MHHSQRPRDETVAYKGTVSTKGRKEAIALMADGYASVSITERRRDVRANRVVPVIALGVAGVLLITLAALGILPDVFLRAGEYVPYVSGAVAIFAAVIIWRALYFKVTRVTAQTPLDQRTLESLASLKGLRGAVTDDLLTVVHVLATIEQAEQALEVAKVRVRLGGSSPRLQRQEESSRALIEDRSVVRDEALGVLLEKVAREEEGS